MIKLIKLILFNVMVKLHYCVYQFADESKKKKTIMIILNC